jgi:hypothetical protein
VAFLHVFKVFNWHALQYVPDKFRDYEICQVAVAVGTRALEFVPEDLLGREFLEIMASSNENI